MPTLAIEGNGAKLLFANTKGMVKIPPDQTAAGQQINSRVVINNLNFIGQGLQAGSTSDSIVTSNSGVLKRLSIAEVVNANLSNVAVQGELTSPTASTTTQSYTVTVSPSIPAGTDFSHIELYFNGIRQRRGASKDYTIASATGTTVIFDFFATVTKPVITTDIFFVEIK